jgi:hypothetical protein
MEEELFCLQAEERGLMLIVRGWGETMDLGLLNQTVPERKLSTSSSSSRYICSPKEEHPTNSFNR